MPSTPRRAPARPPTPAPRGTLSTQVLRTALRLLSGTVNVRMWVDCSLDNVAQGASYGRALVYRLSANNRLAFLAVHGAKPGFGGKVELILDLEDNAVKHTARVAATVAWIAPDPDAPRISLMAVRLAPTNQPMQLQGWDVTCHHARRDTPRQGPIAAVPERAVIDALRQRVLNA